MNGKLYNLSNPQKSIWMTEQFYKGSSVNTICGYNLISGVVNLNVLKKAIYELVKTNEALKIKINESNGEIKQYIDEDINFEIEQISFNSIDELEKKMLEFANTPIEINNKEMFVFRVFELPDGRGGIIVCVHHLISDSWTLGLIAKEVIKIYEKMLKNTYSTMQYPLYTTYLKQEEEYQNSEKYKKDKEFWDKTFETIPEVATIQTANSEKKEIISCKGKREEFILDNEILENIKIFCKENKISIYNFFMSIYSTYISKISGLEDFVIGTPILNRTNFEQKHTMGMFVNVVPQRIKLNSEMSFIETCKNIAVDSMAILRHQKYLYQTILEELRKKDNSIPNLYNILLSYQITKTQEDNEIKYNTGWVFNGTSADDIQIQIFDINEENKLTVAYDYKSDKFEEQEICNIHKRVINIINQVLDNNEINIKNIEVVTPEEKEKILIDFNNTTVEYPKGKTIINLFEEQVEKTPNNIAVVFEDKKITYKELNEKVNQLAWYLINQGVEKGDSINIFLKKSTEMVTAILAVLKAGACYIPIDKNYPEDRVKYIAEDSKSKFIITSTDIRYKGSNVIYIDKIKTTDEKKENTNLKIKDKDLAYTIYTSGSTGNPKGVMISHLSLLNYIYWCKKFYCNNKETNFPLYSSISFDLTVTSVFTPLICGGCITVYENDDIFETLKNIFTDNISDIVKMTPAHLSLISELNVNTTKVSKLIVGGDILLPEQCKKVVNLFKKIKIYNEYGPTEATVGCMIYEYNINEHKYSSVPIGKPIDNAKIYVLDRDLKPVPINCEGEMYIGGDCLSLGYKDDNLNKQKFINNPFIENEKIYKTGDIALFREYDNIEYVGRSDFQIKLNGFRIEIGEITKRVMQYKGIKDCYINVNEFGTAKALCSYYVAEDEIEINSIKLFLSKSLPEYMIPKIWTKIDKIPLTINGKVNKKLLPIPSIEAEEVEKPRNEIDRFIIKNIFEITTNNVANINSEFFKIGFDSLSAISLAIKLSKEYDTEITIKDIFNNPTIKLLADYIANTKEETRSKQIKAAQNMSEYPLSSAQKRIYYSSIIDKDSTLYNIAGGIIVDNKMNVEKLKKCFEALIERHQILRTHFEIKNNEIIQIIDEKVEFDIEIQNDKNKELNEIYKEFVKPFDLTKAPLLRTKLVKIKGGKMLFLLDMHHIISDGTSLGIILQELCDLYNGKLLKEKVLDYKDFTLWEKEYYRSKEFENIKDFWVSQYKDEIPLLNMPTTFTRPSVQSFEGANYHIKLQKETYKNIENVAKKLNVTPYMLMLAVYYILLQKYTSQNDIVVGTPTVGRELPELSNMLGMFVNTLALRSKIDTKETFNKYLETIKEYCINAFDNQAYPFDELVNELKIKRDTSRSTLIDTMFIFQNNGYPKINFNDTSAEYYIPDNNVAKFDLSLEVIPIEEEYDLRFEYCVKLFDGSYIKRFAQHYINILQAVLENNEIKIAEIDMLSDDEKNQILNEFNNTKIDYPKEKTIIQLFEEQVAKTPNNIAVVFEGKKLTYKELNKKANQLGRFLLANNVKVGDIVGILLDKSLEAIIAILAILKVGGAFLPIDISYPNDRIDYILRNSKAKILLTNFDYVHKANKTVKTLIIQEDSAYFEEMDSNDLKIGYDAEKNAYIMYTSGSTGNPKGVMVTNKNVVRLVKNNNYVVLHRGENILQTGSLVFDACTFEIWGALLNGYKLFIMKKEDLLDAYLLKSYLEKNKISTLWLTAPLFNQLCETNPYMFKSVKNLLTGGDVLSPKHINLVRKSCPKLTVINGYGPTENTTFSTCFTIKKYYNESIPIGKPIMNSTAYVVSPEGRLCPIDVPGELWVGGDGVSKGYLNNQELTDEKFIDNPFGDGKLYKTGDLTRWLPDGNIEFIGRIDNQIKLRGFRVELSEINNRILENSLVKEAFTTIQMINDEKNICAYIVPNEKFNLEELKRYLKNYLPEYMLPTYFVELEKLPLNQNGKVDKNALPTITAKTIKNNIIKEAISKEEKELLGLFKKLLNKDNIGITDGFFENGGDSLLAMKLQVEAVSHNINITYSDIFKYQTVEELVKYINNANASKFKYEEGLDKYNYLLKNNTVNKKIVCKYKKIGNVFLTGFTGFLGAHILDSFLKKENGKVYCLIRGKNNMSAKERLFNVLHFYFEDKYDSLVNDRIILVEGDITSDKLGLSKEEYEKLGKSIDMVIHSAALVKHYGQYDDFEKINVLGTKNIVEFSKKFKTELLHISTISVSGNNLAEGTNIENYFGREIDYDETKFYIGQNLENLYVKSKFEAEKVVFDAIKNGINACVLRMGNLTSRYSEGKFQQNHFENAFVNRIKSFLQIGFFPKNLLKSYCEFTPIDSCADAVIKIGQHFNPKYTVFHLLNEKHVYLDRLFKMLTEIGIDVDLVTDEEFKNRIQQILENPKTRQNIDGIINDLTFDKKLSYKSEVNIKSEFTKEFLQLADFEWPYIDLNYIRNYFRYLKDIGYFNIEIK